MRRSNLLIALLLLSCNWSCMKGTNSKPCSGDSQGINDLLNQIGSFNVDNTLFPNTNALKFASYSYAIGDATYLIDLQKNLPKTDICQFLETVTVHFQLPKLIVPVTASKLTAIAISTKPLSIKLDRKSIANIKDIVWSWNTGLQTGSIINGNYVVNYSEGRPVDEGQLLSQQPKPLRPGTLYYLSMWAWDEDGINITHSSACIPFLVNTRLLYDFVPYIGSGSKGFKWTLTQATRKNSNVSILDSFATRTCYMRYDGCDFKSNEPSFYYGEDTLLRKVDNFDFAKLVIPASNIFLDTVSICSICEKRLVIEMIYKQEPAVLTFSR